MPVTFVDQFMAYIATSANLATFIDSTGLAAYAGTSFTRRYGQNNFEVDSVALAAPEGLQLQEIILDDLRFTGNSQRSDHSSRKQYDIRYHQQQEIGWVDASFVSQATFSAHAIPGSFQLGPDANIEQDGVSIGPLADRFVSNFLLSLTTDSFTLTYPLSVYIFVSASLSPTQDLRRILEVRAFLQSDPAFLRSLDGTPDQRPLLFAQIYPGDAAAGSPITEQGTALLFDADDILSAFFSIPA